MRHTIARVPVAMLANGTELALTIHEFAGEPGSIVGVSAAIHGDEPISVEIVRRLAAYLDQPGLELRGTVRLLPVANPLAYEANTRHTPGDQLNLNRSFPGDADGWLTEQLAAKIASTFLVGLDAYVDLHAGGAYPVVDYVYLANAPELSRAFGSRLLFRPETPYAGTSASVAEERGIKTVTVELGGGLGRDEQYAQQGLNGVLNVLRRLGVLPGNAIPAPEQLLMHEMVILRPHTAGILVPEVHVADLATEVSSGAVLGRIYSPYTFEELETVVAPFARSLLVLLRDNLAPIQVGAYMYMIGNGATAQTLAAEG